LIGEAINVEKALAIQAEFERIINKYGLWSKIEHDKRPGLKMITIREISIKVTEAER
jgi:hypothetical protein